MSGFGLSLKQTENMLRLGVAQFVLALFLLLGFLTLPVVDGVKPDFFLIALYYWAIYRPTIVPFTLCFGAGLVIDVLGNAPLGIHALIFILVRWMVSHQRRFLMGQPYAALWAVFGVITVLSTFIKWALFGMAQGSWGLPLNAVLSGGLTIFLFPFATLLLVRIHKLLPVASRTMHRVK